MMDIDTARTFATYGYALVLIALIIDFCLRIVVRSEKLHNKFLRQFDKYGWLWYLLTLSCVNEYAIPSRDGRVYLLMLISLSSLVISWYRYKEIIPKIREETVRAKRRISDLVEDAND